LKIASKKFIKNIVNTKILSKLLIKIWFKDKKKVIEKKLKISLIKNDKK
jgi:hypothetical protein